MAQDIPIRKRRQGAKKSPATSSSTTTLYSIAAILAVGLAALLAAPRQPTPDSQQDSQHEHSNTLITPTTQNTPKLTVHDCHAWLELGNKHLKVTSLDLLSALG